MLQLCHLVCFKLSLYFTLFVLFYSEELKLPSSVKRRGRLKGMDTTTIGLPSKRSKKSQKVKPIILKHPV